MLDFDPHPALSALPMGLILVAFLLECVAFLRSSLIEQLRFATTLNVAFATLFSIVAFVSGYGAGDRARQLFGVGEDPISLHHSLGRLLLFVLIPGLVCRLAAEYGAHHKSVFTGFYRLLLLASVVIAVYTGYLGGKLVFTHGAGVAR